MRYEGLEPIAILREEGGPWMPFPENRGGAVHAVKFSNGEIWDAYSGWRSPRLSDEARREYLRELRELTLKVVRIYNILSSQR